MLSDEFKREVMKMSKEDVHEAWEFLKLRHRVIDQEALYKFNVNEVVRFKHKKITMEGIIKKINNSRIQVEVIDPFGKPTIWTCSPSILIKVR